MITDKKVEEYYVSKKRNEDGKSFCIQFLSIDLEDAQVRFTMDCNNTNSWDKKLDIKHS